MSKQTLRILTPIKRVLDPQLKPRINEVTKSLDLKNLKFSINPFDDIAIEESLTIRKNLSKAIPVSTHAVTIGSPKSESILRTCLAKGVEKATLIKHDAKDDEASSSFEPLIIAKILKEMVKKEDIGLVIMGKQAIDDDFNNTGQMLAGLLNWPQITNVTKLEFLDATGDQLKVRAVREIDGGNETLVMKLPGLITVDLGLNTPRYVKLQNMMKAKKKPIEILDLKETFPQVDLTSKLELKAVEEPAVKKQGIILNSVDELITKLKEEKVI
ncbi:Cir1p NDAI_0D02300 [Naumovozyma dairenensis CBS 421]|uniref:Probable electron transfer flavoprotein subunit beta n=1 Tax=Naumovozyma dairenensis (strain ATCC 10597 / BCRC 20456 / CBS 421 / NBRC 0211 / NRRL Y-12639) TaxID=1071378 RepID=G0W9T3_NAUDC|nr:hypothetical protein NDAI_0D02300 [Naumovozyma dairenensis CBS 421]CCD24544.1 hypothetical protein NDAI_0D02300 [Naumovozyma dairenensis CBS 421]